MHLSIVLSCCDQTKESRKPNSLRLCEDCAKIVRNSLVKLLFGVPEFEESNMFKQLVFVLLLINLSTSSVFARVPPRNSPATAEETVAVDAVKAKEESPTESNPVEKTPVSETGAAGNDEESSMLDKPRKPIGVILFRTQPQISIFRDRSPFGPTFGSDLQPFPGLHAPHFGLRNGFGHDDPAIRLLCEYSLCFSKTTVVALSLYESF